MQMTQSDYDTQLNAEVSLRSEAQDKAEVRLNRSANTGNITNTAVGNKLVSVQQIKDAAAWVCTEDNFMNKVMTGTKASEIRKEIRVMIKDLLLPKKDPETGTAIAADICKAAIEIYIDTAVQNSGDKVEISAELDVVDDQDVANVAHAIGAMLELKMRLQYTKLTTPSLFYQAGYFLKDPIYGEEYTTVATEAALRGLNVSEVVTLWKEWKETATADSTFIYPPASTDAPEWTEWTKDEQVKVAGYIMDAVDATMPQPALWTVVLGTKNRKRTNYVVLTESGTDKYTELLSEGVISARIKEPMTTPPISWSDEQQWGGYLLNQVNHLDTFIRRGNADASASETVYAAVNKLQSVGYVINSFILEVADALKTGGSQGVGKYLPKVAGLNKRASRNTVRTEIALAAAHKYTDGVFYTPWNVDYRGRMYPLSSVLHVQSTDFEKSLLKLSEGVELTDENIDATNKWLCVHIANVAAMSVDVDGKSIKSDKLSLDGRVQWVVDHEAEIKAIATDPLGTIELWSQADKPWMYLAACEEYNALFFEMTRTRTDLLVATDCTCSGIQILSGVTHDADAATLVNVSPSDTPQDAYDAVAKRAAQMMTGEIAGPSKALGFDQYVYLLDRKLCKKVVMTLAYNSSPSSHSEYIKAALKDVQKGDPEAQILPTDADERKAFLSALGLVIRQSMKELLPQVISFKDWVNKCAAAKAEAQRLEGVECITWTTHSGFTVSQKKNKPETITLNTSFGGVRGRIELKVADTHDVEPNKHGTCTMPNLVHSLDASVLHTAYAGAEYQVALIHDSVMTTAADMDQAINDFKESYIAHFASGELLGELAESFGSYSDKVKAPTLGGLDISEVRVSNYMLS